MKNWNIQHRFLLMGMLPGILISLVLGGYFITHRFQDLNELLDQRALAMANQLAPVCEYGVTVGNRAILQNIANNMLEEPDVRSISIYDQDMRLLAHSGPRMLADQQSNSRVQRRQMHLLHTSGSVRVRAPILAKNLLIPDQLSNQFFADQEPETQLLGWAELELSATNTQLAQYQYLASAMTLIALTLIACLVIAIRISRQFSVPSSNILSSLKAMADGKYETRVRVEGGGELSEMADTINTLAATLQRNAAENQRTLEEATRDMQETMDDLEIRNRQLLLDQREAREASRLKSEFLANISHELRTPLNSICGYADMVAKSRLNPRQQEWMGIVSKSTNDLVRIINDILDLSKLEAGKLIIEHNPFNLRENVEDVLDLVAPAALSKHLDLALAIDPDVPVCLIGDHLRLKQVLTNLIGNAVKFTERGSVSVNIRLVKLRQDQASIQFEIVDTGIGMSSEQQQRLFNAFTQADSSTARRFGGSGLGLIISRALVEAMNGEILVQSSQGEGSVFSFHITADIDKQATTALPDLAPGRIAVLDDRDHSLLNIHQVLTQWSLESIDCRSATTLEKTIDDPAIELDAIIMAVHSEVIGTRQCQQLVDRLVPRGVPILALVDSTSESDRERLVALGARTCLSRPLNSHKLHRILQRLLNGESLRDHSANEDNNSDVASISTPPTILAVDDNEANLKLVVTLLEDLDLPVLAASSGAEAVQIAHEHDINLVLMDIQMPGMNGLEATRAIREIPGKQRVPVLALTAHAMSDERELLLREGMNDYETKPILLPRLIDRIHHWTGYRPREGGQPSDADDQQDWPEPADLPFSAVEALKAASHKPRIAVDMMTLLLSGLERDLDAIREAWEEENMRSLQEKVHKLHGATRYCGVPELQASLQSLEHSLKQQNHQQLPEQLRAVVKAVENLQQWAQQHNWQQQLQDQDF